MTFGNELVAVTGGTGRAFQLDTYSNDGVLMLEEPLRFLMDDAFQGVCQFKM